MKEMQEKRINKRDDSEEFESSFPCSQAWPFHREFAFSITKTRFNLPSSCIGKKNIPSMLFFGNSFVCDKTHDMIFRTYFYNKKLPCITCMRNWCPPNITGNLLACFHIFHKFMCKIFFILS